MLDQIVSGILLVVVAVDGLYHMLLKHKRLKLLKIELPSEASIDPPSGWDPRICLALNVLAIAQKDAPLVSGVFRVIIIYKCVNHRLSETRVWNGQLEDDVKIQAVAPATLLQGDGIFAYGTVAGHRDAPAPATRIARHCQLTQPGAKIIDCDLRVGRAAHRKGRPPAHDHSVETDVPVAILLPSPRLSGMRVLGEVLACHQGIFIFNIYARALFIEGMGLEQLLLAIREPVVVAVRIKRIGLKTTGGIAPTSLLYAIRESVEVEIRRHERPI